MYMLRAIHRNPLNAIRLRALMNTKTVFMLLHGVQPRRGCTALFRTMEGADMSSVIILFADVDDYSLCRVILNHVPSSEKYKILL